MFQVRARRVEARDGARWDEREWGATEVDRLVVLDMGNVQERLGLDIGTKAVPPSEIEGRLKVLPREFRNEANGEGKVRSSWPSMVGVFEKEEENERGEADNETMAASRPSKNWTRSGTALVVEGRGYREGSSPGSTWSTEGIILSNTFFLTDSIRRVSSLIRFLVCSPASIRNRWA